MPSSAQMAAPRLWGRRVASRWSGAKPPALREVGGTVHMNFARQGSQFLTVTVLQRPERSLAPARPRRHASRAAPIEIAAGR
jgi:hypothetical protein